MLVAFPHLIKKKDRHTWEITSCWIVRAPLLNCTHEINSRSLHIKENTAMSGSKGTRIVILGFSFSEFLITQAYSVHFDFYRAYE